MPPRPGPARTSSRGSGPTTRSARSNSSRPVATTPPCRPTSQGDLMPLGLQGAYGNVGAQSALCQRIFDQLKEQQIQQQMELDRQTMDLREREAAARDRILTAAQQDRADAVAERTRAARDTAAA